MLLICYYLNSLLICQHNIYAFYYISKKYEKYTQDNQITRNKFYVAYYKYKYYECIHIMNN